MYIFNCAAKQTEDLVFIRVYLLKSNREENYIFFKKKNSVFNLNLCNGSDKTNDDYIF